MNSDKFLPIGTVCRLKNAEKSLMIIGFSQSDASNPENIFDYAGCMYPEGVFSSDMNFLFNHEQIETIFYKGYVNEEELEFKRRLNEFLINGTIDGQKIELEQPLSDDEIPNNNFTQQLISQKAVEQQVIQRVQPQVQQQSTTPMFNTINLNQQNDINNN